MRKEVLDALSKSAKDFVTIVWPVAKPIMGGGELIPCEHFMSDELKTTLDQSAGVDGWQIIDKGGMSAIASRVQYTNQDFQTFTIRFERPNGGETELSKRLRAIKSGGRLLYPYWTVQAFLWARRKKMGSIGIVHTKTLMLLADDYRRAYINVKRSPDGEKFVYIRFDDPNLKQCKHLLFS